MIKKYVAIILSISLGSYHFYSQGTTPQSKKPVETCKETTVDDQQSDYEENKPDDKNRESLLKDQKKWSDFLIQAKAVISEIQKKDIPHDNHDVQEAKAIVAQAERELASISIELTCTQPHIHEKSSKKRKEVSDTYQKTSKKKCISPSKYAKGEKNFNAKKNLYTAEAYTFLQKSFNDKFTKHFIDELIEIDITKIDEFINKNEGENNVIIRNIFNPYDYESILSEKFPDKAYYASHYYTIPENNFQYNPSLKSREAHQRSTFYTSKTRSEFTSLIGMLTVESLWNAFSEGTTVKIDDIETFFKLLQAFSTKKLISKRMISSIRACLNDKIKHYICEQSQGVHDFNQLP